MRFAGTKPDYYCEREQLKLEAEHVTEDNQIICKMLTFRRLSLRFCLIVLVGYLTKFYCNFSE